MNSTCRAVCAFFGLNCVNGQCGDKRATYEMLRNHICYVSWNTNVWRASAVTLMLGGGHIVLTFTTISAVGIDLVCITFDLSSASLYPCQQIE